PWKSATLLPATGRSRRRPELGGGLRPPSDGRHAPNGAFLPASPQIRIARAKPALEQPRSHFSRVWSILSDMSERRRVRTMCPMNCHPTLCGMLVDVEDGRLLGVAGDPDNPDSQGFLCVRGQASREIIGNPQRLLHPLVRARRGEDAWRRAEWAEVLDRIAATMRAVGREAVGTWSGHGLFASNYGTRIASHLLRRFSNLYGCQWWNPTMICWGLGAWG